MGEVKLVDATPEQQRERDKASWSAWGAGLTREQFLTREARLRAHPWAKRTMRSLWWVDASGAPLSSCELFTDTAHLGRHEGRVATIASVFTEEAQRGNGHAAAMLKQLVRELSTQGLFAVTLFSEIGVDLYQRVGFWPVPAFDTYFPSSPTKPEGVEWHEGTLPLPRHGFADTSTLRVDLSAERLDWHLERERIYGEVGMRAALPFHGASVNETANITWTAYWKTNELQVLTLGVFDSPDTTWAKLIGAAQYAAHLAGLPVVRVWETIALPPLPGARRVPRTDEIAMFCPITPGVQAWTRVERALWA